MRMSAMQDRDAFHGEELEEGGQLGYLPDIGHRVKGIHTLCAAFEWS
jgi:hypothetical protein